MKSIDLNCDMGESFGAWEMGNDAAILPFVSSVSIACGFHAGDPSTIAKTIRLAAKHGVAVGAHPSYPDLQGFGRRAMKLEPAEIYDLVAYQVAALRGLCKINGQKLNHVKPHGALYNQAAVDPRVARAIARSVKESGRHLILYGLAGSHLIGEAESIGLKTASEVFADRTYADDATLTPRMESNALIDDTEQAVEQALGMIEKGSVTSTRGKEITIRAQTLCIHGDGEHAVEFAKAIRSRLDAAGVEIKPVN